MSNGGVVGGDDDYQEESKGAMYDKNAYATNKNRDYKFASVPRTMTGVAGESHYKRDLNGMPDEASIQGYSVKVKFKGLD